MALKILGGPLRLGGRGGLQIKSGGAAAFNPASGVTSATLKSNLDFSTLAGADGSAISTFTDPVSSAAFVQATGANQPLVKANAFGALKAARFDGVNDTLTTAGLSVPSGSISVVAVINPTTATIGWVLDAGTGRLLFYHSTSGNTGWFDASFKTAGVATSGKQILVWVLTSGGNGQVWRDGASVGTAAYAAAAIGGTVALGAAFNLATDHPFPGDMGQILVYQGALSTADRQYLQTGLKAKWGTP